MNSAFSWISANAKYFYIGYFIILISFLLAYRSDASFLCSRYCNDMFNVTSQYLLGCYCNTTVTRDYGNNYSYIGIVINSSSQ